MDKCVICGAESVIDICPACQQQRREQLSERLRLAAEDYSGPPDEPIPDSCVTGAIPGHRNAGHAEDIDELRRISSNVRVGPR